MAGRPCLPSPCLLSNLALTLFGTFCKTSSKLSSNSTHILGGVCCTPSQALLPMPDLADPCHARLLYPAGHNFVYGWLCLSALTSMACTYTIQCTYCSVTCFPFLASLNGASLACMHMIAAKAHMACWQLTTAVASVPWRMTCMNAGCVH